MDDKSVQLYKSRGSTTSSNRINRIKLRMKFFLFALFFAIGVFCISAHHPDQIIGDTTGTPSRTYTLQLPAAPEQIRSRWIQLRGVIYSHII